MPARGCRPIVAVARIIVSPQRTVTAPPARLASLPVSTVSRLPPTTTLYCFTLNIKRTPYWTAPRNRRQPLLLHVAGQGG